jgi:general secretion pathway protein I
MPAKPNHAIARLSPPRRGLSLLEVLLALAILGVAMGILAQAMLNATNNGISAQRLATAQLLAESKISELQLGLLPLLSTDWTDLAIPGNNDAWYYRIEVLPSETPNLTRLSVTVSNDPTSSRGRPLEYQLSRLMIDPALGLGQADPASAGGALGGSGAAAAGGTSGMGGVR